MTCLNPDDLIGKPLAEVDTPSLLLEAGALEANIQRLGAYFANRPSGLRPHFKSHKCTRIAKMQMAAGAVGITCAKLGEAEAVADAGIREILVANQIVGPIKIARLVRLARRSAPFVAVDCLDNAEMLSEAAASGGVKIGVLIEVDIGMNRCGVQPGAPALDLARRVASLPGLQFMGLQAYEGHIVDLRDPAEREQKVREALELAAGTRRLIEGEGLPVAMVTGGGTGSYTITGNYPGYDEVQAGSYAAMDWWYSDIRPEFQQSMSILATVISRTAPDVAVIDVGRKGVGAEFGPPRVKDRPGADVSKFGSEEHTVLSLPNHPDTRVGDKIEIIPSHGCTTSNLYREFVVHRHGLVEDVWPIEGSGRQR